MNDLTEDVRLSHMLLDRAGIRRVDKTNRILSLNERVRLLWLSRAQLSRKIARKYKK
jgi:hypothetical protein